MPEKKPSPSSKEELRAKSVTWANESRIEEVVEYEVSQYEQSDMDSLEFEGGATGRRYRIKENSGCCCIIM